MNLKYYSYISKKFSFKFRELSINVRTFDNLYNLLIIVINLKIMSKKFSKKNKELTAVYFDLKKPYGEI